MMPLVQLDRVIENYKLHNSRVSHISSVRRGTEIKLLCKSKQNCFVFLGIDLLYDREFTKDIFFITVNTCKRITKLTTSFNMDLSDVGESSLS